MPTDIKKIQFRKKQGTQSFFDFVRLSDVLSLQPTDHNQFENHRLTFFVLLFIHQGKGKHSINFKEYTYQERSVFAIGRDSIHKFYKSDAQGSLLVFTEDFILQYLSKKNATKLFQLFNEQLASPKLQLTETNLVSLLSFKDYF